MDSLEKELHHRRVPIADIKKMKIAARKDKLKKLETERLMRKGMELTKTVKLSKKHFRCLSGHQFVTD